MATAEERRPLEVDRGRDVVKRGASSFQVPLEHQYGSINPEGVQGKHRADFVRKVYGILAFQMTITVVMCLGAMHVKPLGDCFIDCMTFAGGWLLYIPTLCTLCCLQVNKAKHPVNYQLLVLFTIEISIQIAGLCALYQQHGEGFLILQAFAITTITFFTLSAYALFSGQDFTWMGGLLLMSTSILLWGSLFVYLFGLTEGILFPILGCFIFCGWILYDTSRLLYIYGPDDAISASVELYLDILNLFLCVLQALSRQNR